MRRKKDKPLFNQVSIFGVGLIGGSLGLGIKEKNLAKRVIGFGHHLSSLKEAKEVGAIDAYFLTPEEAAKDSGIIILSLPVRRIIKFLEKDLSFLKEGTIITDTGSTKEEIEKSAKKLSKKVYFVGSHPISGSEKRGAKEARGNLFKGKTIILTKTPFTNIKAFQKIKEFWEALGGKVNVLSPSQHDSLLAFTSHLPHLVAASLVNTLSKEDFDSILPLIGSGFLDTTRIAKSPPEIWEDIFLTNKKNLLSSLNKFKKSLALLETTLKEEKGLKNYLKSAKKLRELLR